MFEVIWQFYFIQTCLLLHHIQICGLSHAAANSYWILQVEWLPKSRAVQMPEFFSCHWYIQTGPHIVLNCVGQASTAWQLYNALHSMYIPFMSQLKPHNSPDLSRLTVHILLVALMALGGLYEESFAWIPGCCIGWLRIGWSHSWSLWVSDMTGLNCVIEKMKSISVVDVEVPSDVLSEVSWNPYRPPKHGLCTSDVTKELLLPAFCWPWKARSSANYCGILCLCFTICLFEREPMSYCSISISWGAKDLHVAHICLGLQWPTPFLLINFSW